MILPVVALGLFLLGQVGRLSFNQQEINIYLYEIPYFTWIIFLLWDQRNKLKIAKAVTIFLSVLVLTFICGILNVSAFENIVSSMYLLRLFLYLLGFSLTVDYFVMKKFSPFSLRIFLTLTGVVGVVQYFLYSNLRNLQHLGWDPHLSRVFGQFLDTSVAGAIYGLILIFILYNQKLFPKVSKWSYVICYMFLGLLTYSRGFFVSIFVSALSYSLIARKNFKAVLIAVALIVVFVALSPKPFVYPSKLAERSGGEGVNLLRTSTIQSRIADYGQGLKLWQKSPLVGIGYNRIRYFKPVIGSELKGRSHAGASFHSSYLIILVTAGAVGLAAFAYWLWNVAKISNFSMISAVFLGIYSLFDNILLHPFILFLWPVLIGVTSRRKQ